MNYKNKLKCVFCFVKYSYGYKFTP